MSEAVLAGARAAIPYLCVSDADKALPFYVAAFGAQLVGEPIESDGRIGHAALRIGEVTIFLADEFPAIGFRAPSSVGACTVSLVLIVDDVDAFVERAEAHGTTVLEAPADGHCGRMAKLVDPFGHRWIVEAAGDQ